MSGQIQWIAIIFATDNQFAGGFLNAYTYRMLLVQGYQQDDVIHNQNLNLLARWTPFACGCFGTVGLILGSPSYF